jgi:hypothetical protein
MKLVHLDCSVHFDRVSTGDYASVTLPCGTRAAVPFSQYFGRHFNNDYPTSLTTSLTREDLSLDPREITCLGCLVRVDEVLARMPLVIVVNI